MAPPSEPLYKRDEKALCFHHELLYEAKVLDSKPVDPNDKKSAYQYKVHYKGWKNTYVTLLLSSIQNFCVYVSVFKFCASSVEPSHTFWSCNVCLLFSIFGSITLFLSVASILNVYENLS